MLYNNCSTIRRRWSALFPSRTRESRLCFYLIHSLKAPRLPVNDILCLNQSLSKPVVSCLPMVPSWSTCPLWPNSTQLWTIILVGLLPSFEPQLETHQLSHGEEELPPEDSKANIMLYKLTGHRSTTRRILSELNRIPQRT
jgi:hypothetical protein